MTEKNKNPGLVPMITAAGLAAAMRADLGGVKLAITKIGLGDGSYDPKPSMTRLKQQQQSIPVGGAEKASPTQVHLTAIEDGSKAYWIREIGFFLDDGTLFALWSDPDKPLAYKAPGVDLLLAFDLVLEALPSDLIEVNVKSDLSLLFASEFAKVGIAIVGLQRREFQTEQRLKNLSSELDDLEAATAKLTQNSAENDTTQSVINNRLQDQLFATSTRLEELEKREAGVLSWLVNLTRMGMGLAKQDVKHRFYFRR